MYMRLTMFYSSCAQTVLHLWWTSHKLYKEGYCYKITLNDKSVVYTKKTLFDFFNLQPDTEYKVTIQLCDENKLPVADAETEVYKTLKAVDNFIDITKAPYFAVGDGIFDNTEIILKAISDCKENDILLFPMGTYLVKGLVLNSDVKFRFENDANLVVGGNNCD